MTGSVPRSDASRIADHVGGLIAARQVPRIYNVSGRADVHGILLEAVRRSGGTVLYASSAKKVPVYIGLEDADRRRLGLMRCRSTSGWRTRAGGGWA